MELVIISALACSLNLALLNEVIRLRWWKAPLAVAFTTACLFVLAPHMSVLHRIVLVWASSYLSLLLLLLADRLAAPAFPPVFTPRK